MEPPSRSAVAVALHRAVHQVLDPAPVFVDPLAVRILGARMPSALAALPARSATRDGVRAFIAVRSRLAEDELAQAVARGVRQYVILGAGLDTFAYRNPHRDAGLRVFEVDQPGAQTWKLSMLQAAGIEAPKELGYAAADLGDSRALARSLAAAGFDDGRPAFFGMLGVAIFVPRPAVLDILEFVAARPALSGIAFDYGMPARFLTADQRALRKAYAREAEAKGEPFLTFLDRKTLGKNLRQLGFDRVDDLGARDINARYFAGRADGLRVPAGGRRVAVAWRQTR